MKSTPSGSNATAPVLDVKHYIQHHPRIGYCYMPNYEAEHPRPGGGTYRLRTNGQGIRADRDFAETKREGSVRCIVLGDSFAAGQYVNNAERFSERLEQLLPNLEVINLGLEGTGTDQQTLIYEEFGQRYAPDFVVIMPFLQNIRRNQVDAREAIDPKSLHRILQPKPRFRLAGDELVLENVPVPTERPAVDERQSHAPDAGAAWKSWIMRFPPTRILKELAFRIFPWEPFPEYRSAATPAWQLMAAILRRLRRDCAPRPLLIVPVFYANYLTANLSRNYLSRFTELAAEIDATVVDLLPYFQALGSEGTRCFYEPHDCHFSPFGHRIVADALAREFTRLGLVADGKGGTPK